MRVENRTIVSICCITYNQAAYIRAALDSFLMQEPPTGVSGEENWYEILIHDDASTDGTEDIIREYAAKYPDKIYPIYEKENQYSRGHAGKMDQFNFVRAKGRYIAVCEGDDYWTDTKKLQKQVDFMDQHPECTVTFHRYNILQQEEQTWRKDRCDIYLNQGQDYVELTLPMYFAAWVTQPCTMMFRKGTNIGVDKPYRNYKDQYQIFHLLNEGKGYLLNFNGAVYRENRGGIHGRTPVLQQTHLAVEVAEELYENNGRIEVLRNNLVNTLDWAMKCEKNYPEGEKRTLYRYMWRRCIVSRSLIKTIKQIMKL